MLELRDIVLREGAFELDADVTIAAPVTTLIGPSGAGKSTVLNAIAGFFTPERGQILWQGRDLRGLAPADRPVSILFQDNNLFPHLTIAANLALALTTRRPTKEQRSRIAEALAQVGLPDMAKRKPAALSGGQQGRAALARVLLQNRPLMLLDEPFAALGPALRAEMLDLVVRLSAKAAIQVILVSHAPEDARRLDGETAVVSNGKLFPPQPTKALLDAPPPELQSYLGKPPNG